MDETSREESRPGGEEPVAAERDGDGKGDLSFGVSRSEPRFDYLRMAAGVGVGLVIVFIVLFSLTDLSALILPMDERYLDVLVPSTEDGSEPFVLNELTHELVGNSLSVRGRVTNRSTEIVENVLAVIAAQETTGRFPVTVEAPVAPSPLEPGEAGSFSMSVTLLQKPNSYSIRFKLANGPFVPHSDERGFAFELVTPEG